MIESPKHRTSARPVIRTVTAIALVTVIALAASADLAPTTPTVRGPLTATLEAHGGLDRWRAQRTFAYTLDGFPLSPQVARPNRSTVDLKDRSNHIEGEGWDGARAWSTPGPDAIGLPPRFFALASFYFIGMPFVFADPGVVVSDGGYAEFRGRSYRVVHVAYERAGHTPEDDYTLFIDPDTNRLALIHHSVTETGVERVTWVFDAWQEVDGLLVPSRMTFHPGWNPQATGEGTAFTIEDVRFGRNAPPRVLYEAPSVIAGDAAGT